MRTILSKINELKYKLRSLEFQKEELMMSYGLTGKGSQVVVKGGQKDSPQERISLRLELFDQKIKEVEKEFDGCVVEFKNKLKDIVEDIDTRLIIEQRLLWGRDWQNIDTIRYLSVSRKQHLYYSTIKVLESGGKDCGI